ncbi:MAG TPA: hypothetical protein VH208_01930 [Myxococcaceae bacterium]|jgi:hypothetical protein|nr:hypothetical protein [Myxococcaceae bacterium]
MLIGRLPADYRPPRVLVNWRRPWAHLHVTGRDNLYRKPRRFSFSAHLGPVYLLFGPTALEFQAGPFLLDWCHLSGAYWHRRPWRRLLVKWQRRDETIVTLLRLEPAGPAFRNLCRCRRHRAEADSLDTTTQDGF